MHYICFSAEPVIIRLQGHELTLSYLVENGFDKPILVETSEGLDIKVPHESITANDILNLVGMVIQFNNYLCLYSVNIYIIEILLLSLIKESLLIN